MGTTIFIFVFNLLIPIIILILGLIFKNASTKINYIYGYRTVRSMKNQDTWEFANKYSGSINIKMGIIFTIIGLVISLITMNQGKTVQGIVMIIWVTVLTIAIIATIPPVEKALKKNFDDNGNRRLDSK